MDLSYRHRRYPVHRVEERGRTWVPTRAPTPSPASAAFEDFLCSHAVALTPPARACLAGLSQAGPHELPLCWRHEAAMRTVFATGGEAADLLAAGTGPLPDGMAWIDLLDATALEKFLAATEPDQAPWLPRPGRDRRARHSDDRGIVAVALFGGFRGGGQCVGQGLWVRRVRAAQRLHELMTHLVRDVVGHEQDQSDGFPGSASRS
ncbi:hypothetical protein ACFW5D_36885 [Streptomyces sp. NPDC058770]|uniref:hypothetical protein n=1 Tax=Streptomyces sp. NPDC058770 TaxID=3346631 RepID=UPI0036B6EA61